VKILCHLTLLVSLGWFGGLACATVVRDDYSVTGVGEGGYDMSELMRCLREAVDEKNYAFRVNRRGIGLVDIVDADCFSGRSCDCSDAANPVRGGI